MNTLENSIGKYIYVGGGSLDTFSPVPIFLDKTFLDFKKQVETVPVDVGEEFLAVNGLLTTALGLPAEIPEGVQIFLIVPDADLEGNGFIVDVESLFLLEKIIQTMVNYSNVTEDIKDEVIDYITNVEEQDINNIFILYGHHIELAHTVLESSVKELSSVKFSGDLMKIAESQNEG